MTEREAPAIANAEALADRTVEQILFAYFYTGEPGELEAIKGAAPLLRNSAPQETREDELRAALEPFAKAAPCAEITDLRDGDIVWRDRNPAGGYSVLTKDDFRRAAKAFAAASQQSPRLEREGLIRTIDKASGGYNPCRNAVADAILALLSPDTTVASSTSQVSPGFTQCAHCWQPATCKKYGCSERLSSKNRGGE